MTGLAQTVRIAETEGELRLDRWFRRHYPALAHGRLEKLLRTGQIRIDGRRARAGDRIIPGQEIRVPPLADSPAPPASAGLRPQEEAFVQKLVLHRDEAVIVLDKPAGLAVQGGSLTERHLDGLLDGLRFGYVERPRLAHRLDKDTSGVLVVARTPAAAAFLTRAFRDKATRKIYWAIVAGRPEPPQGRIGLALAKRARGAHERVVADAEEGRHAVTYYRVLDNAGDRASWLALVPVTGRTHQLRAHCAAIGTPILGDAKYGGAAARLAGPPGSRLLHLHSRALQIPHPAGGTLRIGAPLPRRLRQSWEFFGFATDLRDPFAGLEPPLR